MPKRKSTNNPRVDQLLDELLEDCRTPEEIIGEEGLLKHLTSLTAISRGCHVNSRRAEFFRARAKSLNLSS
jgi:hypothetical protein